MFTEATLSPPHVPIFDLQTLATRQKQHKKPTQKHVKQTLQFLAQQESAFLEHSIVQARMKTNKMLLSADNNHDIPAHNIEWQKQTCNISDHISSSIKHAVKQAKKTITTTKAVDFVPTHTLRTFHTN